MKILHLFVTNLFTASSTFIYYLDSSQAIRVIQRVANPWIKENIKGVKFNKAVIKLRYTFPCEFFQV